MTREGLRVVRLLGDEQIATDVGLVFTATQALLAARSGSAYVSPSVGELDDAGQIGMDVVESIVRVFDNYGLETQICVQGIQNPIHVLDAAALGADVATLPVRGARQAVRASPDGAGRGVSEKPAIRRPAEDPLISRERAVDLSHRMIERLARTPGVALAGEREFVRNHVLQALLAWDKENERLATETEKKLLAKARRVVEGSREWDLLFAEEMERAYAALLSRGE